MFCMKCGTENAAGNRFCRACGNKLLAAVPASPSPRPKSMLSDNTASATVKGLITSPLFLTAIIAFSCGALFNLLATVSERELGFVDVVFNYVSAFVDVGDYYSNLNSSDQNAARAITVIGMIPSIIIAVGFWIVFAAASKKDSGAVQTQGFTVAKVGSAISVFVCNMWVVYFYIFCYILIVHFQNFGMIGLISKDFYNLVGKYVIIAMIIVAVADILLTAYYLKIFQTINTVKETVQNESPFYKLSAFVAVMCFIMAFFSIFGLFGDNGLYGILQILSNIIALICFGTFLFDYNRKMSKVYWPDSINKNNIDID